MAASTAYGYGTNIWTQEFIIVWPWLTRPHKMGWWSAKNVLSLKWRATWVGHVSHVLGHRNSCRFSHMQSMKHHNYKHPVWNSIWKMDWKAVRCIALKGKFELKGRRVPSRVPTERKISKQLKQFNNCFDQHHCEDAKNVLRYFKGTIDKGLIVSPDRKGLLGYSVCDWGTQLVTGVIISLIASRILGIL